MNKRKDIVKNNLKEYRLKAGLTQVQAANKIGVNNQERISHWEKGENVPNLCNLIKLCKVYNAEINVLYPGLYH